jgi:NAD(P)-dependent dehydrogenase (short-subunit alcohol dehydrogenase family)
MSSARFLVTGGSQGIGAAIVTQARAAGHQVVFTGRNQQLIDSVARDTGAYGIRADITDAGDNQRTVDVCNERFGGIDVLVNNAALYGTLERKPFFEIGAEEWDRVLAVNLKGAFLCAKAAYPHMRARGGRIVNIASASAMSGSPLWLHYVSSKGGMIAMTRGMARELGEHGITVNAVAPGFTLTEASRKISDNAETWGVDRGAIRRAEQPEDVVGAVLWLASPHSDFVTGQTLIVDGGRQFA